VYAYHVQLNVRLAPLQPSAQLVMHPECSPSEVAVSVVRAVLFSILLQAFAILAHQVASPVLAQLSVLNVHLKQF
jgi:hypothetical protein